MRKSDKKVHRSSHSELMYQLDQLDQFGRFLRFETFTDENKFIITDKESSTSKSPECSL